jgi:hypothetical protein
MKNLLLRSIPDDLMRRFKTACASRGITMRAALLAMMAAFCRER